MYRQSQRRLDDLIRQLGDAQARAGSCTTLPPRRFHDRLPIRSNFKRQAFEQAVRRCVEYIRAGDIFQVVISQRLQIDIRSDPFEIYRTLRVVNPSPFMFFLRTRDTTLVGSSPEIMCRVIDGKVTVRPLAGTRRRGQTRRKRIAWPRSCWRTPKSAPST